MLGVSRCWNLLSLLGDATGPLAPPGRTPTRLPPVSLFFFFPPFLSPFWSFSLPTFSRSLYSSELGNARWAGRGRHGVLVTRRDASGTSSRPFDRGKRAGVLVDRRLVGRHVSSEAESICILYSRLCIMQFLILLTLLFVISSFF